ncbi:4-(cytidine 5'-diphospho)-2-C-methyl-D-erythritol kinase [Litorisediminicola beolgyonensis]|uniref:4-diphosphocytidyl-2-C-methyl-D-erythritol kinase n=1 Tax=Litorisediminicola beolgyonensis TaxID=1173614 RepID=A0ABW3ZG34_9RHOB
MIRGVAPAKINLALHVTGQREDGYHLLDSLVVFADVGDVIAVRPGALLALDVAGPMSKGVPRGESNLIIRAARALDPEKGAEITLHKRLPVEAGLGGGSSDAACALRLLSELWEVPIPDAVDRIGADVPVCLAQGAQRVRGIGEVLEAQTGLPELPAVLINPGVAVPTPDVFAGLERRDNPGLEEPLPLLADRDTLIDWLSRQRNDLEAPALRIAPVITDALEALSGARLARMSGSGATCFGLYDTPDAAEIAALNIARDNPGWWVRAVLLNPEHHSVSI